MTQIVQITAMPHKIVKEIGNFRNAMGFLFWGILGRLLILFYNKDRAISNTYTISLMGAVTGAGHLGDGSVPINKCIMQK
jgi:hypothetical protein